MTAHLWPLVLRLPRQDFSNMNFRNLLLYGGYGWTRTTDSSTMRSASKYLTVSRCHVYYDLHRRPGVQRKTMPRKPYKYISADNHLNTPWLPGDLWQNRLPARLRTAGPRVVETGQGSFWAWEGKFTKLSAQGSCWQRCMTMNSARSRSRKAHCRRRTLPWSGSTHGHGRYLCSRFLRGYAEMAGR
jgi:hypothetical protein